MARTSKVEKGAQKREMRADALPLWGSAAAIALAALTAARMQPGAEMPVHLLILVFAAGPLALGLISGQVKVPRAWWSGVLVAAAVLTALGFVTTVSPGRSVYRGLALLSAGTVFASVALSRRQAGTAVCAALALGGAAAAAIGANEYAVHARAGDPAWRVFSTFFNPGFLSGFLAFSVPATLALLVGAKDRGAALGLGFAAVLQFVALSLTGARAGVMAGGLGVAVFLGALLIGKAAAPTGWRRIGLTLVTAIALAAVLGRPTGERVASPQGEGHSFAFRKYTWAATARMASARPVTGFGPGTYEVAMPRYAIAGFTRLAHSNYLQAAAESGIPAAVVFFAGWFAVSAAAALRLARKAVHREAAPFVAAALGACAATAVRGVFDSDWWCLPILLAAAAMTGLLAPGVARARECRPAGWLMAAAGAAALVLIAMSGVSLSHQAAAEAAESAGDWTTAQDEWDSSSSAAPWNARARLRAAELAAVSGGAPVSTDVLSAFARLRRLEPTNARIPTALGDVLLRLGNRQEALDAFREARKLDPKSPRLLLEEARLLESLGRGGEALALWGEMTRVEQSPYGQVRAIPQIVDATYAWAHAAIGDDLKARGEAAGAVEEWRKAAGLLARREESLKEMRPVLEAAGALDPEFDDQATELLAELTAKLASAGQPRR